MSDTLDISLTCLPRKDGRSLVFDYRLRNHSRVSIYAADAIRTVDYDTRLARADDQLVTVMLSGETEAVIGKFLPPVPPDWEMVVPLVPLTVLLEPGAEIERSFAVQLPLAETSPLVSELTLREYDMVDIDAVLLTIGYWPADTPDLLATPTKYAPGRMQIMASDPTVGSRVTRQRLPVHGLVLFRRNDAFSRTL